MGILCSFFTLKYKDFYTNIKMKLYWKRREAVFGLSLFLGVEMVSTVYTIISIVLAVISLLTLIFGYVRNLNKLREGMKAMLRSEIEHCYYKNLESKTLKEYERKNLDSLYAAYHDGLKGNTFAQDLYEEMRDWRIVR